MTIQFPNQSRNFDASTRRVRFWGYDAIMEVCFYVEAGALQKLRPQTSNSDADLLEAFDALVDQIHTTAQTVYERGRKGSYVFLLRSGDF